MCFWCVVQYLSFSGWISCVNIDDSVSYFISIFFWCMTCVPPSKDGIHLRPLSHHSLLQYHFPNFSLTSFHSSPTPLLPTTHSALTTHTDTHTLSLLSLSPSLPLSLAFLSHCSLTTLPPLSHTRTHTSTHTHTLSLSLITLSMLSHTSRTTLSPLSRHPLTTSVASVVWVSGCCGCGWQEIRRFHDRRSYTLKCLTHSQLVRFRLLKHLLLCF